jgi:hypothetical protein
MYDFSQPIDPADLWRGVIGRNIELLQRTAPEFFLPREACSLYVDTDGIGIKIAVDSSSRPEGLLKAIKRETFPTFGPFEMKFDGQRYYVHFRASVPTHLA